MTVRTRIAPSPTGEPHVGTAYIALFNYAFARKHGGRFILRIEDTDQNRSHSAYEKQIMEALDWLGIVPDEGPAQGGPYGPYRQSERRMIYQRYANELLERGGAFYCFCTEERLAVLREDQRRKNLHPGYDGHCRHLSRKDIQRRLENGEPYVLRLVVPEKGACTVRDLLRGDIEFSWNEVDASVLIKSDGMPTYHFASVVDDHLMGITHVIRGEEWISSAPKHLALYQHFGWEPPVFCHLPLLRNPDKSKLSKRKNPTSILYYQRIGILPEALRNYLGLMAWSMPDGREMFTLEEMIEVFELERISLGGPVFDIQKLTWLNGRWMREKLSADDLYRRFVLWMNTNDCMRQAVQLAQVRAERLSDIASLIGFLFDAEVEVDPALMAVSDAEQTSVVSLFNEVLERLDQVPIWNRDAIETVLRDVAAARGEKLRAIVKPLYVAFTGKTSSIPLFEAMELLGKDLCRARLVRARHAITTAELSSC